jgi:hypothetical protein
VRPQQRGPPRPPHPAVFIALAYFCCAFETGKQQTGSRWHYIEKSFKVKKIERSLRWPIAMFAVAATALHRWSAVTFAFDGTRRGERSVRVKGRCWRCDNGGGVVFSN